MSKEKPTAKEIAQSIADDCKRKGWTFYVDGKILTISKTFTPGDMDAFVKCDSEYYGIISQLPRARPGSDWGTDGGGVGGYFAHKSGQFTMSRSGGSIRVLQALARLR